MKKCKCIKIPSDDFYKDMLVKLKLGEIYYYMIDDYNNGLSNLIHKDYFYSLFTLDDKFVMGGLSIDFYELFIDLIELRKQKIEKLLCSN